jgi:transcriptional regulator with GAF, ATPase, and Fis domain
MNAFETASQALGSIEAEVRASTAFETLALVLPWGDGRLRVELRTPNAVAVNLLTADDVLPQLRLPCRAGTQLAPLSSHLVMDRAFDKGLAIWQIDAIATAPVDVPAGKGLLFGARFNGRPFADDDLAALRRVARQLEVKAREPEPDDVRESRLARVDALAAILPRLAGALDLREIFGALSALAKQVLPHDAAIVGLHEDNHQRVRVHALSMPPGVVVPETVDNPYPGGLNDGWLFMIHRDLAEHPVEHDRPARRRGMRSAIRAAIWMDGRVCGILDLSSSTSNTYSDADVPVAVAIVEYIRLALSHKRLADGVREAEALRERTANIEMLEQLLETLAGALDIRDVFDRVSSIARKVLPHDAMSVPIILDDPPRLRVHALSGFGSLPDSFEAPMPEPRLMTEPWDHLILNFDDQPIYSESPGVQAGMRSVLCVPIRLEGRLQASVNFYSRTKGAFTADHVPVARRITDHIALALSHQRLVDEARRTEELRLSAANLELLDELLAAETHAGDLDDVFDRVSAIAGKVLPHDTLLLPVALPDGRHARIHARGGDAAGDFPNVMEIPDEAIWQPGSEFDLIGDLQQHPLARYATAASFGFRSVLRVPVRLEDRYAGALVFFSFQANQYKPSDVMVAHRIADRIALVLARDRSLEAARRAEEAIARAARLEARLKMLTEELDARTGLRRVVGESATWRQVLLQATRVAAAQTTVLLLGESGTGKEVVARFVHRASERGHRPFIALNCAALPEHLLEAELFGYERGAFTGAAQSKPGQLEQAAGGTLFLDEVGEMSLPAQAKFLRVLQEREFQRLGGTRVLKADARIIAATNRDLEKAMSQNAFREDLFYRLNVFAIRLPPLRERPEDILPLSEAFLAEIGRGLGRPPSGIARDARDKLLSYRWPGNVRELRNVLERAAILCDGGLVTSDHLALADPRPPIASAPVPVKAAIVEDQPAEPRGDLKSVERKLIEHALQGARFNKSKAAKALGLTRAQLYVRMRRYGLE